MNPTKKEQTALFSFDEPADSIGKDEMNLAEFPFAVLSRRVAIGQKTIEVIQESRDTEGRVTQQEWLVTGSDRFGLPVAADDEVYVALMKILRDTGFATRTVRFTIAQLLRVMHSGTGKRDYDRVSQALDRLTGVMVRSKNAFWDHSRKRHISEAFHLLESYRLAQGGTRELSEVTFSEFLFASIQAGYVKNLDTEFYFGLSNPLARRYYRLLDKHQYRSHTYEIELWRLAQKLPLQDSYASQVRRRLDPVHTELIEKGFLAEAGYRRLASGQIIVSLRFATSKTNFPDGEVKEPQNFTPAVTQNSNATSSGREEPEDGLDARLIAAGVSRKIAAQLVSSFPAEEIERQLAYLPFAANVKNPGGYLRLAIEHGYGPPPNWTVQQAPAAKTSGPRPLREKNTLPEPAATETEWEAIPATLQATLLAQAESDLRTKSAIWGGTRRIPKPVLQAHALHLYELHQRPPQTFTEAGSSYKVPKSDQRENARETAYDGFKSDCKGKQRSLRSEADLEEKESVRSALKGAPFLQLPPLEKE